MAADGFAYLSYVTYHSTGTRQRAAQQAYPDAAFDLFDQLRGNVSYYHLDWDAALSILDQLVVAINDPSNSQAYFLRGALTSHDYQAAFQYLNVWQPQFQRACDRTSTVVTKMHLMRVNGDGQTSDAVVKEWTATDQIVYTLNPSTVTYTSVETHTGPNDVNISEQIITNADRGALFSWQASEQCYVSGTSGTRTYTQVDPCPNAPDNHLTTMSADASVADRTWTPGAMAGEAVRPVLQLSDGAFAGDLRRSWSQPPGLIVFDANGQVRWQADDAQAAKAISDGGLIAYNSGGLVHYDAQGAVSGAGEPPLIQSWNGNLYQMGSVELVTADSDNPASFWPERTTTGAIPAATPFFEVFVAKEFTLLDNPPYETQKYKSELLDQTALNLPAQLNVHLWAESTAGRFQRAIVNRQNDAVAFIGDSIEHAPEGAVGLQLSDMSLVKRHDPQWIDPRDCIRDAGQQCVGSLGKFTLPIDRFVSNVKIVFIASCQVGETFLQMWGIDINTKGRSLIVPASGSTASTDLFFAAKAWELIAIRLANGLSVFEAVDRTNKEFLAPSRYSDGTPVTLRFMAIGGNGGRDVSKKK
jgi:hypothetical protein